MPRYEKHSLGSLLPDASLVLSSGMAGDVVWQAGSVVSTGQTWNDGYAIYPTDSLYQLLKSHYAAMKAAA